MVPMHGCKAEGASHETWIGTSSPRPSPPLGAEERVPGGRERRRFGSMSQCMRKSERGLSKNRPGHRIVAWLGKAALKTHALQTLRDCRASPKRAKRLECVRFIGAVHILSPCRTTALLFRRWRALNRRDALLEYEPNQIRLIISSWFLVRPIHAFPEQQTAIAECAETRPEKIRRPASMSARRSF